jgi:dienelactone hydrolase
VFAGGALAVGALAACGGERTVTSAASMSPSPSPSLSTSPRSTLHIDIPSKSASFAEMKAMYDYDTGEPLDFAQTGTEPWNDVTARVIRYNSAGTVVTGYLVIPEGEGPFPVVLCAPGGGGTVPGSVYLIDGADLAHAGIATLAIDPPDYRPPHVDSGSSDPAVYIRATARYVVDLRRALDLLQTLPEIDSTRIGYIGGSWGGAAGALLAGVDERVKAYVLTYPGGSVRGTDPDLVADVQDPAVYVAHNRGASFLLQYGRKDVGYPRKNIDVLIAAIPGPKTVQWVSGGHYEMWDKAAGMFTNKNDPRCTYHCVWLEKNL